jgi:hypothetical protein
MRDSEKDHATIVQLLASFIRRGSPMPKGVEENSDPVVPDDVKAALMVIGNRPARQEDFRIDLANTCLRHLSLSDTNFEEADFSGSDLSYSVMLSTNFRRARFSDASLCYVVAHGVDLDSSRLQGANLYHSDLTDAKLGYAYLRKADLTAVTLKGADMAGASLVDTVLMAMDGCNAATISVEQLLTMEITSWTALPDAYKDNQQLGLHIAKCDEDYVTGTPRLS